MPGGRFGFDYLQRAITDVLDLETLPADRRTIVTARLIAILADERARVKRLKTWNEKQRPPA